MTALYINRMVTIQRIEKWNTDDTDSTDLHGFLVRTQFVFVFKSVFIRLIRVIRVLLSIR